jgi:hypothetical protein
MGRLTTSLLIDLIIDDDDAQVLRLLGSNGREAAKLHQEFAIACNHQHRAGRLGKRKTQPDHACRTHCVPKREGQIAVAYGCTIPNRRAAAGDNKSVVTPSEKRLGDPSTVKPLIAGRFVHHGFAFVKVLAPSMRCDTSTATRRPAP